MKVAANDFIILRLKIKNGAKIDVLGVTYTVVFVKGMDDLDSFMDTFALCDIFKKQIKIWEGLPESNLTRIFFHELLHAVFYESRIEFLANCQRLAL